MGNRPFDSAATKVIHREEAETDTYELTEHAANVPLGTSSSRVPDLELGLLSVGREPPEAKRARAIRR